MTVATQWRQGFGGRTGLDYVACISTLRLHLPRWRRESRGAFEGLRIADLMQDVQTIESAMLTADAERREHEEAERERNPVT